jgi:hypothetical protein
MGPKLGFPFRHARTSNDLVKTHYVVGLARGHRRPAPLEVPAHT